MVRFEVWFVKIAFKKTSVWFSIIPHHLGNCKSSAPMILSVAQLIQSITRLSESVLMKKINKWECTNLASRGTFLYEHYLHLHKHGTIETSSNLHWDKIRLNCELHQETMPSQSSTLKGQNAPKLKPNYCFNGLTRIESIMSHNTLLWHHFPNLVWLT